jgi:hypothetical protein
MISISVVPRTRWGKALTLPLAAGAPAEDVLAAIEHLESDERGSLVVVLDALDKAKASRDIARRLLLPLARDLGVKVLVGTRPGRDAVLLKAFDIRRWYAGWTIRSDSTRTT